MTRTILMKCVCLVLLLLVDVDWAYAARRKTAVYKKRGHRLVHHSRSHDIHTVDTHDSYKNKVLTKTATTTKEVKVITSNTAVEPNKQKFIMSDDKNMMKLLNNISSFPDVDPASLSPEILQDIYKQTNMKPGDPNLSFKIIKLPPSVTTTHHTRNATHQIINITTVHFHDVAHPIVNHLTPVGAPSTNHTVRKTSISSAKIIMKDNLPAKPPIIALRSGNEKSTILSPVKPVNPNSNSRKESRCQQKIGQAQVEPTVNVEPVVKPSIRTQCPNQSSPKPSQVKSPLHSSLSHSPEPIQGSRSAPQLVQHSPSTSSPPKSCPLLNSMGQTLRSHFGLLPPPSGASLNSSVSTPQKSGSPSFKRNSSVAIGSKNSMPISQGSSQNKSNSLPNLSPSLDKSPNPQHDQNGGTLTWKSHIMEFTNSEMCLRHPYQCKMFTNMLETFSAYDGSTDPKTGKVRDILSGKSTFGSFATEEGNTRGLLGTEDFTGTFNNMNDHDYPPIGSSPIRPDRYSFGLQHAPQVLTSRLDSITRHFRNSMSNTPHKTSRRDWKSWDEGQNTFRLDKYKTDSYAPWSKRGDSNNDEVFFHRQFNNPKYVQSFSNYRQSPSYYQLHEGHQPESRYTIPSQEDEEIQKVINFFKPRSVTGNQFPLYSGLHHEYNNINPSHLGQNQIKKFSSLPYKHITNPFLKIHLPTEGRHFFTASNEPQKNYFLSTDDEKITKVNAVDGSLSEYRPFGHFQYKQSKFPHTAHEKSSYSAFSNDNEFNRGKTYASYLTPHHNINHEPHFEGRKRTYHSTLLPPRPVYTSYDPYARSHRRNNRRHRESSNDFVTDFQ